jgi:hypothetical protein
MLDFEPLGMELIGRMIIWNLGSTRGMIEIFLSER